MEKGKGVRLIPVVAAFLLLLTALAVLFALHLTRLPPNQRYDDALLTAQIQYEKNDFLAVRRQLLRGSRFAVTADHWRKLLALALALLPSDPVPKDYRLFSVLAGRAAAAIPGNPDFSAFYCWGNLRMGRYDAALRITKDVAGPMWSGLRAEARIQDATKNTDTSLSDWVNMVGQHSDPEFLQQTGFLSESAEITMDAALLFAKAGRMDLAYNLASEVMRGKLRWKNAMTPLRRGVYGAMARIAYDAGWPYIAIEWLNQGLITARLHRMVFWEELLFLGDLYWEMYQLQDTPDFLTGARNAWNEGLEIIDADAVDGIPSEGWKLFLNLAMAEKFAGNLRRSEELLLTALTSFPKQSEVKAAWSRQHLDDNPALARRLLNNRAQNGADIILDITTLQVDSKAMTPRLYEASLWELFHQVTQAKYSIQPTDARNITVFLLEYMAAHKNYASIDIALDQYFRFNPTGKWALGWRLSADSSRKMGSMNLIPSILGKESAYIEFRQYVRDLKSWRGLHDVALYAFLTAQELNSIVRGANLLYRTDTLFRDAMILEFFLNDFIDFFQIADSFNTRFDALIVQRPEITKEIRLLSKRSKKGRERRNIAYGSIAQEIPRLYQNALEDLDLAMKSGTMSNFDRAKLWHLRANILRNLGQNSEANESDAAARALDSAYPEIGRFSLK